MLRWYRRWRTGRRHGGGERRQRWYAEQARAGRNTTTTDTCSSATFTDDPDLDGARNWRSPGSRLDVRMCWCSTPEPPPSTTLRSLYVCVSETSFKIWKSYRHWKVSLKYCVSGSFASKCFVECCRKHTAEQTEMNLNWFKHEVWVLQLIRMENEIK